MTRLTASAVRDTLGDTLNRVAYRGERIILERHGKAVAALVSVEDLSLLELGNLICALQDLDCALADLASHCFPADQDATGPLQDVRLKGTGQPVHRWHGERDEGSQDGTAGDGRYL